MYASLLKHIKCIKVNSTYTQSHPISKQLPILFHLASANINKSKSTIQHKVYCMFCTTVKPENRLQMFPQFLPKTKFEKVQKTKESWKLCCRKKKRHKESVALLRVNLFCLHLLDKKGQSWISVNTETMKYKNSHFLPVYYSFKITSQTSHTFETENFLQLSLTWNIWFLWDLKET